MLLIRFRYEHYCQGFEWVSETVLVNVSHILKSEQFQIACNMISKKYLNAKDFENLTL